MKGGPDLTIHHFSVDVEEYFHPSAVEPFFPQDGWEALPRRSPDVVARVLQFLAERESRATFFIVGWLAEREPGMVRSIAAAGHEVAAHSWDHRRVPTQVPADFRASVRRNKRELEDLTGAEVLGFRAPSFSIVPGLEWALDVLLEEGYRYDSSLFPIRSHPAYGYPGAGRDPYFLERPAGRLVEVPPTTLRLAGRTLPAAGGAYFRFFPYRFIRAGLEQAARRGQRGTFYIHPWELDDFAPPTPMPWRTRLRTFGRQSVTWPRLERLFRDFRFQPIADTVRAMSPPAPTP
jgi:polysaccharide deacetylase family protein (PEP-CTERM system associated)